MKNEAKGYRGDKENNIKLPKINDRSHLQKQGAAIMAAGGHNKYRNENVNQSKNDVLSNIYGRNNNGNVQKPPVGGYKQNQDKSYLYGNNYQQRY